jgi:putative transposase
MHNERCTSGSARGHGRPTAATTHGVHVPTQPKLLGPAKWTYYYLYVLLDLFSRYVVGWMLAHRESGALASRLVEESCHHQGVEPSRLSLHSDRGPAMTSQSLVMLAARLGIELSHSRPHVSNDNPFSEAQFKTFKYRPEFPTRFGSYEHALSVCRKLFHWYKWESQCFTSVCCCNF